MLHLYCSKKEERKIIEQVRCGARGNGGKEVDKKKIKKIKYKKKKINRRFYVRQSDGCFCGS